MTANCQRTEQPKMPHTIRGTVTVCRPRDIETLVEISQSDGSRHHILFQWLRLGEQYPYARGLRPGDDLTAIGQPCRTPDGTPVLDVQSFNVDYQLSTEPDHTPA